MAFQLAMKAARYLETARLGAPLLYILCRRSISLRIPLRTADKFPAKPKDWFSFTVLLTNFGTKEIVFFVPVFE